MTSVRLSWLIAAVLAACSRSPDPSEPSLGAWRELGDASVRLEYQDADASLAPVLLEHARAGRAAAAAFFGESFTDGFTFRVYPTRQALTDYWRSSWGQTFSPECWMVASATRALAVTLSPRRWSADTCGHGGSDSEVRLIMAHEIVHVLNGQLSASTEVNNLLSMKWLTEGLAFYAAGQFDESGRSQVRALIAGGYDPTSLERIWSGQGGYGASASIVAYIDAAHGRSGLRQMLRASSNADALAKLGISEAALLQRWRAQAAR